MLHGLDEVWIGVNVRGSWQYRDEGESARACRNPCLTLRVITFTHRPNQGGPGETRRRPQLPLTSGDGHQFLVWMGQETELCDGCHGYLPK